MTELLFVEEIKKRFEKEDPFDLTIEKWTRIRKFSETAITKGDFAAILDSSGLIVPFCIIHKRDCPKCPLDKICGSEQEKFSRIMRVIDAFSFAWDIFPKKILLSELDSFISELEMIRAKNKGSIH